MYLQRQALLEEDEHNLQMQKTDSEWWDLIIRWDRSLKQRIMITFIWDRFRRIIFTIFRFWNYFGGVAYFQSKLDQLPIRTNYLQDPQLLNEQTKALKNADMSFENGGLYLFELRLIIKVIRYKQCQSSLLSESGLLFKVFSLLSILPSGWSLSAPLSLFFFSLFELSSFFKAPWCFPMQIKR